jgi:Fe-S-cluster-containing hydrogenase component 2
MVEKTTAVQMKRLYVKPSVCIGCRTCELACTFVHSTGEGKGLRRSRVRVHAMGDDVYVPVLCLQCEEAGCIKACPVGALTRNEETGAIDADSEVCVRCMSCVVACPFGNIYPDPANSDAVVKCDTCGGNPACAMFCPTKALEYR